MFRLSGPTKLKGNRIHLTGNLILDVYDDDDVDGDENQIVEEFTMDEPPSVENGDQLHGLFCQLFMRCKFTTSCTVDAVWLAC